MLFNGGDYRLYLSLFLSLLEVMPIELRVEEDYSYIDSIYIVTSLIVFSELFLGILVGHFER